MYKFKIYEQIEIVKLNFYMKNISLGMVRSLTISSFEFNNNYQKLNLRSWNSTKI